MIPKSPSNKFRSFDSQRREKEKTFFFGLFNRDYWRGRSDGRKAPAACQASLENIQSEELLHRNEIRSGVHQMIGEAKTNLNRLDELLKANQRKLDDLRAEGGLLAEGVAESVLHSGRTEAFWVTVLIACEITGLAYVGKSTFGQGLVPALVIAALLSGLVALGVKLLLGRLSPEKKTKIKRVALGLGLGMTLTGLLGFVFLRAETFRGGLLGGKLDLGQISFGNFLLMLGLTLGVPLICGVLYEDAHERTQLAGNSLRLYRERGKLGAIANEWNIVLRKLEEFDGRLDAVTEQIVAFRKSKYVRGFHVGGAKNPEATQYFKFISPRPSEGTAR